MTPAVQVLLVLLLAAEPAVALRSQPRGASGATSAAAGAPSPKLAQALPVHWVHVPKSGSSFLNALIHLPGVCPSYPDDLVLSRETLGDRFLDNFTQSYHPERECPGMFQWHTGHESLDWEWGPGWERGRGHFMIMLRQPEQRLLSARQELLRGFERLRAAPAELKELAWADIEGEDRSWGGWPFKQAPDPRRFAEFAAGCATRMLVRPGHPCGGSRGPPTDEEVREAKRRLREGFDFVGITDRWALSMCLFAKTHGVACRPYHFLDTRPGHEGDYPTWPLMGFKDRYDGELYAEALRIFEEGLERHNVSEASCAPCFREAGLAPPAASAQGGRRRTGGSRAR
mmetsp:Transcript_48020/g.128502  ORF Transcript_48020/g.128502 Transcript_48020/m.128502 type:complete len:343 (-) Transcript_48020:9-1037(-)